MKTAVTMKRKFLDGEISQNSKTEFFSSTDLLRIGNKWRIENGKSIFDFKHWSNTKSTKEFIKELEEKYGKVKISAHGRGHHTWVHPYLFIDLALSINPKFKIEVYSWLYDYLIKYRNQSGDSYKKMCGALYISQSNKSNYKQSLIDLAKRIKIECGVTDWQIATEKQLKLRDKIHDYIALLTDILRNREQLISTAIDKAKQSEQLL